KMQHHIWTMDTDGKNLKRITSGKGFETHPSFSPDQKYISFTSNRNGTDYEIYTTTLAGEVQQITHNPGLDTNPCFSSDGQKIVFVSNRSGTQQIWMMDQDGSNPVALTEAETPSVDPAWGAWELK
ncbi:tolB protein precursor, periplasmic protein involved in the tonb-independent uptake of group A colicins, partial [hydrothermal vent metagenome]